MDRLEIVRTIPLFSKLNDDQLAALAALCQPEHHYPLAQIVRQGDLGNRFFVIASGTVSMRRTTAGGAESVIGGLAARAVEDAQRANVPKNYFGEQMFSSQEPYDFHADAVTEVDVFRIHRKDFDELVKSKPQILRALDFIKIAERKRTHGFRWVGEGETVVLMLHKHWWALVPKLVPLVLLVILAALAIPVLRFFSLNQYEFMPLLGAFFTLVGIGAYQVANWYNDEYIVTNQRVAHVERNFLFQQELRDTAPIDKVQGAVFERQGLAGVILGVAKLVIQTPGREQGNITFDYVGNVQKLRDAILRQQESNRARLAAEAREQFRTTVRGELRQYLAPDLTAVQTVAPKPLKRKQRGGMLGKILNALGAPFNLELHYGDRVVWRKHWILFLSRSKKWLAFQFGMIVLFGVVTASTELNTSCLFVTLAAWIASLAPVIYEWLDWRNDIYAVTETQIIDSERAPFGLSEKTSVAPLDQITDIVVDIPGILATLFDFGTLKIDTAGRTGQMIFETIHQPRSAQEEIYRRIAEYKTKRAREEASIRSSSVVDAILAYHRLQEEKKREEQSQSENPPASAESSSSLDEQRVWKTDEPKPGAEGKT